MEDKLFINDLIIEIAKEVKTRYSDFKGIYFFGSRAVGNYNEYSDYDMAFVFDRNIDWNFKDELRNIIFEYMLKYEIIIDAHIYNHKDILYPITPFRENVYSQGRFYAS